MYLFTLLRRRLQLLHQSPLHPAVAQLLHLDMQAQGIHSGAAAVLGDDGKLGEHQAAQGVVVDLLAVGQLKANRLGQLLQIGEVPRPTSAPPPEG